jgi:hypothetical protein
MFFHLCFLLLQALAASSYSFCSNQIGAVIGKTIPGVHAHQSIVTVESLFDGYVRVDKTSNNN